MAFVADAGAFCKIKICALLLNSALLLAEMSGQSVKIEPNGAHGPGVMVEVQHVIPYSTAPTPSNVISFRYKFEGRKTVFVVGGLGTVPAEGQFTYLTDRLELSIRDSTEGGTIVVVPLKVTFVPAGETNEAVPKMSDFPDVGQDGSWKGSSPNFKVHLNRVLGSLGILSEFCSGQDQCFITEFKSLDFPALHGEKGKVAVKVTFNSVGDVARFRVCMKVSERLSHGSWRETDDQVVVNAGREFVRNLVRMLENAT